MKRTTSTSKDTDYKKFYENIKKLCKQITSRSTFDLKNKFQSCYALNFKFRQDGCLKSLFPNNPSCISAHAHWIRLTTNG